jgi:hypothetical protein
MIGCVGVAGKRVHIGVCRFWRPDSRRSRGVRVEVWQGERSKSSADLESEQKRKDTKNAISRQKLPVKVMSNDLEKGAKFASTF